MIMATPDPFREHIVRYEVKLRACLLHLLALNGLLEVCTVRGRGPGF